jgi:hypothetical protein
MSEGYTVEKLLKIPVTEISVVRVECKNCGGAADIPLDRLQHATLRCPSCGTENRRANVDEAFRHLAVWLQHLQKIQEIRVQFLVPVAPEGT